MTGGGICYALGLLEKSGYWEMQLLNQRTSELSKYLEVTVKGKQTKKGKTIKKKTQRKPFYIHNPLMPHKLGCISWHLWVEDYTAGLL